MNKTMRDILTFTLGFAAGACCMHTFLLKKYQEYADRQIEDVREHYKQKEADLDQEIEDRAMQKSMEQLAGKYRTESEPETGNLHDPIEIIEPDQFGDDDDYETRFLTYYADGKLVVDGEDEPVDEDDIPKMIGTEALKHFGEYMPSAVHVRNHNFHKDYEVLQIRQNWSDLHPDEEDE